MPHPPRARGRQVNLFQALALLLSFVLVAGVGGVLGAGLLLPAVTVANGVTDMTVTAFDDLPTELEPTKLPEKSVILAADGTLLATFFDEDRVVVPQSEISIHLQNAVIAVEDKRFRQHAGVDPTGMLRAAVQGQVGSGDSQQGASTLTQQYVKNVLIQAAQKLPTRAEQQAAMTAATVAEGPEGYARKLREAKLAITLEKQMTKDEILEKYLNIAQFGIKVYGAEAAAQYYFSKPAKDLTYLEAATIAGITQSPSLWDPSRDPVKSQERRDVVLFTMHEQGYITDEEYEAGLATPVADTLHLKPLRIGCVAASDAVPGAGYFCDYVTKVIVNDPAFGAERKDRESLLYQGGLTITTTLDPARQAIADAEVKAAVPVDDSSQLGHALVSVEPGTGKIVAMAQNRIYAPVAANAGEEPVNYNTDFAYGASGGFNPGSTYKPFTLLTWLSKGHSLYESVNGAERQLNLNQFRACGGKWSNNEPWKPNNSEGSGSMMTVLDATRNSVNLAYLSMAMELDMCDIADTASSIGVHIAKPRTADQGSNERLLAGTNGPGLNPSNVLGTDEVAPLTMAAAFATFASGGTYCTPIAITSVLDTDGNPLPVPDAQCHQAIPANLANTMNFALSGVWNGTASTVDAPPFPSAGKTGTTSENEQTWFVGYTPRLSTAVWLGDPKQSKRQVKNMYVGPTWVRRAYGATVSAPTWRRFMVQALASGDNPGFAAPDDKLVFGERVGVPSVVGRSEGDARAILEQRGFRVSVDPTQIPSGQAAGTVAEQSPSGTATKGSTITLRISNGQGGGQPQQPGPGPGGGGDGGPGNGRGNP
ncbi:penicillin-binding protein [Cellulomonas fimi]|uniref:Peptidoglycan glycosyltransferase n=1 Tax=Cellulomonas fimi (strain ATCC 484 / DSM 20113 / JCM 1341 / CCUG 24087 / LMG 16345 / NBRC 15513 / NCIMB 8980 / NCTC 7547 / NRS-133) TaxID=590998 RepID=F4H1T6_CELFA|nr:transglycosylase domain-containing protein [Cellulomonas fimi]AEE47506.1 Peptidoglycan glycosyltransferase [Cellulomonas fimi ATCC 484]NNH05518.1 penicillin-binding protein [Cellulomonas fimi]VEH36412.1 Penicillin-binding protein 4 precursor [Cellulomonas fimi]